MGFPAARMTDNHVCPMVTPGLPPIPHVGGPIMGPCVPNVLIGNLPAATLGDMCMCVGPPDSIVKGSFTVLIGNKPAARMFDNCAHGGMIMMGMPTVLIGDAPSPSMVSAMQASASGAPFCEICKPGGSSDSPNAAAPQVNNSMPGGGERDDKSEVKPVSKKGGHPLGSKEVKDLVKKSPKLTENIETLQKDGWTIKYGEADGGSFCSKDAKEIVIDPVGHDTPETMVQVLAHESGHALYTPAYVGHDGLTKDEYVSKNTDASLKDEGEATLMNAQIRQEILDNTGNKTDIGIAGSQHSKYAEIYEKHKTDGDRDKARQEIADIFADKEGPSGKQNEGLTYRDYYSNWYKNN